jgi:hypothetical protein
MSRKADLLNAIDNDPTLEPLIDDMIYLEEQLDYLRTLPKIKVHPKDKTKQKPTPAARLYREALANYTNIIRLSLRAKGIDENDETSPLREWAKKRMVGT